MMKKTKKSKTENSVDDVDTSSLDLKQLQDFCEKVHVEIVKTNSESRSLELERNKLKTMVELSTQELIKVKMNRREKEFELEQMQETIIFKAMDLQKQLRNIKNEKSQETTLSVEVANNNLETVRNEFDECRSEIERDLKMLRRQIIRQEEHLNKQTIVFKQELETEKSNLLNTFDIDSKLQAADYEKQSSEIFIKLNNKYMQVIEEFGNYKNRLIREYLDENDVLNVRLQHYYEKLQQRNINVTDCLHEKYKGVKDDVKQMEKTLKSQKGVSDKYLQELKSNNEKIEKLSHKLIDSNYDHKILRETENNLMSYKKKLNYKQWDKLFLEEAVEIMKNERAKNVEKKNKRIVYHQKRVAREMARMECFEVRIRAHLNKLNDIIEAHSLMIGCDSCKTLIRGHAFALLEEEAKQEENRKLIKDSTSYIPLETSNRVQISHPTSRQIYFI